MRLFKYKKWAFIAVLLVGLVAYAFLYYLEERPYEGPVTEVKGVVSKAQYVHGGSSSGRSFTRIYLTNGKTYRLPVGQMVGALEGDQAIFIVPAHEEGNGDVRVLSFSIEHKSRFESPK